MGGVIVLVKQSLDVDASDSSLNHICQSTLYIEGRVDDFSFFDCSSSFSFLLIEFHYAFSISYIVLTCYVYYYFLIRFLMFLRRRFDVCALSKSKLKGKGEVMFGEMVGRVSGVARAGVALLLSGWLMRCVVEWKEVSSRLMWVRVKIERERECVYISICTG